MRRNLSMMWNVVFSLSHSQSCSPTLLLSPNLCVSNALRMFGKIKAVRKIIIALTKALGPVMNAFIILFAAMSICEQNYFLLFSFTQGPDNLTVKSVLSVLVKATSLACSRLLAIHISFWHVPPFPSSSSNKEVYYKPLDKLEAAWRTYERHRRCE